MTGAIAPFITVALLPLSFLIFDKLPASRKPLVSPSRMPEHLICWLYVPLQIALILYGARLAETAGAARFTGLSLIVGFTTGIFGVLTAHELIHSKWRGDRILGRLFYCTMTYAHFPIAHLQGHHRLAATCDDPATARRGESVYRFMLRSVTGQTQFAWKAERRRKSRTGGAVSGLTAAYAVTIMIYIALACFIGFLAALYFLAQSLFAIFVLEVFNYIAHYGMQRRVLPGGRLEPMQPRYSWNTSRGFSNLALLNGGRHSDHHRTPAKPYQYLINLDGAPELPFGYGGTMLLALIPPLWRTIMDQRLDIVEADTSPLSSSIIGLFETPSA